MNRNLLLLLVFISLLSGKLLSQNWVPLENGNLYQYIRTTQSPYNLDYSLQNRMVGDDTLIHEINYHKYIYNNYTYLLSFSETDQKLYQWYSGYNRLSIDFSKAPGDTFIYSNSGQLAIATSLGGSVNIFAKSTKYKGYQATIYTPIPTNKRELFAEGIGLYFASSYLTQGGTSYDLIKAIVYDSSGTAHYFTDHFKPKITITPVTTINNRNFRLDFQVSHNHNRRSYSMPGTALNFIASVKIERFYSKQDSIISMTTNNASVYDFPNYIYQTYLDTALLKNGFAYNYRIIAVDRGIIPETSHSPDSGYYQCIWDFSTSVGNEAQPVDGFALHQNYPNPFNPSTRISWQSPVGSHQTLKVFDVLGNEIATLVNEYREAGYHEVDFLPESSIKHLPAGRQSPASGVYFYQLQAGSLIETKKMIYLK